MCDELWCPQCDEMRPYTTHWFSSPTCEECGTELEEPPKIEPYDEIVVDYKDLGSVYSCFKDIETNDMEDEEDAEESESDTEDIDVDAEADSEVDSADY
jgi:hypothetical protein